MVKVLGAVQRAFAYMWGVSSRNKLGRLLLGSVSFAVPSMLLAGVSGATTTTVLTTNAATAKTTVLKFIGIALGATIAIFALMLGIKVLMKLYHRVTSK